MQARDLVELYDYHYWANAKLMSAVAELTPDQFTRSVAGSYESVRNTLVHVLSAEWGWLDRCGGPPRGEKLKAEAYPSADSLVTLWAKVERDMRAFLAGLTDADMARPITFSLGGPSHTVALGVLLQHGAIHAVHHRGQVAMLLRMLGVAPGNFDVVVRAMEAGTPAM
jgi:uncharacterized damage-inducible protein DinB